MKTQRKQFARHKRALKKQEKIKQKKIKKMNKIAEEKSEQEAKYNSLVSNFSQELEKAKEMD